MEVEIVMNGGISLVLIPKNEMEEKALEQLSSQENDIQLIRSGATILKRTINKGVVITKKEKQGSNENQSTAL